MTVLRARQAFAAGLICIVASACGNATFREGRDLVADGKLESAVPKFRRAVEEAPNNPEYRATYLRSRDLLFIQWLEQATSLRRNGQAAEAEKIYRRLLAEDPNLMRAKEGLAELERDARHTNLLAEAESSFKKQDYEASVQRIRTILSENPEHLRAQEIRRALEERLQQQHALPQLSAGLRKPLTIEFKEAPLRQIFEIFSRTSGLNFIFDKEVKGEQRSTIFLRNSTVQNALNMVLLTNQLEQRTLDGSSILIYPQTPAKQKEYQPLMVRTFFLSNVDAKSAANTLKTIIKTKDIVVDEKQNLLVIRDTPDAMQLAEKLMALHDQAEPEIMLEVAIVEVSRSRIMDLGIQWPSQLSLSPLAHSSVSSTTGTSTTTSLTLSDLQGLRASSIGATVGPTVIKAGQTDGDVKVLANPRIRARNREIAKIMIGDRIPNITTTATSTGFVSENIQYVDIGLKLEVQPTVYADNEIAIKISLEVSNIVNQIQTKSGSLAYQIGTRNASTLLKLKDGENQVLAGLIRNDESATGAGLPIVSEIPLLGRLFGSRQNSTNQSEVLLSLTPRLIRGIRRADLIQTELDTGTEANLKLRAIENPQETTTGKHSTTPVSQANRAESTNPPLVSTPPPSETSPEIAPSRVNWTAPALVRTGSSFTIQLAIEPGEPVTGLPFAIGYDRKVLEVIGVNEGDFLKQEKNATNFTHRIDKNGGQVFATITRTSAHGATTPGNIASFTFKALAAASDTKITLNALAPIGVGGRSVEVSPLPPHLLNITP